MAVVSIGDLLPGGDGWPHPPWDAVRERVDRLPPDDRPDGWAAATRQWLEAVGRRLGGGFEVAESADIQVLAVRAGGVAGLLLARARSCRRSVADLLPGVARFDAPGKEVIVSLPDPGPYYSYLEAFTPDEGEYGGSAGVHVRDGYPHTVVCGVQEANLTATLAHELTHAALHHLAAPQWVEEGVTQLVTRAVVGAGGLDLTADAARAHRRHWARRGLGPFWWAAGFDAPGQAQRFAYELAEVLMTLLVDEHRPGWFGIGAGKQARLVGFLSHARAADAGAAAAADHLGYSLGALAGRFLGPGDWQPGPAPGRGT